MRRLTGDELVAVASALGAEATGDVPALAAVQQVDGVVDALASLLVAIVRRRPFDRRNHAVAITSIDLLAQLNGHTLRLSPPEDITALITRIRDGLAAPEVRNWLCNHTATTAPVARPRCPSCSVPLREALVTVRLDLIIVTTCGNCDHMLGRPARQRPRQEA
jgi:hypothetical protein